MIILHGMMNQKYVHVMAVEHLKLAVELIYTVKIALYFRSKIQKIVGPLYKDQQQ